MGATTAIEWTDATWNPIGGCSIKSKGCTNCYAQSLAGRRLAHLPLYAGTTSPSKAGPVFNGHLTAAPDDHPVWTWPLRWRGSKEAKAEGRPSRIFVGDMSDLFHEDRPDAVIDRVFAVMALCPQHRFLLLTKRPERMLAYVSEGLRRNTIELAAEQWPSAGKPWSPKHCFRWPLPNVWLAVSAEDQTTADERIPLLLAMPAAVRFVSAEPLLGPINFINYLRPPAALPGRHVMLRPGEWIVDADGAHTIWRGLDQIIVGGESGPNARPMHPQWARDIRDQCQASGVAYFYKQWGEWASAAQIVSTGEMVFRQFETFQQWVNKASTWVNGGICLDTAGNRLRIGTDFMAARDEGRFPVTIMHHIGKKAAGRLLDGREHNEFPEVRS